MSCNKFALESAEAIKLMLLLRLTEHNLMTNLCKKLAHDNLLQFILNNSISKLPL